jgi:hypothetical protein
MKKLVAAAKENGHKYTCESCHVDIKSYALHEDARSELATLLEDAKVDEAK